MDSSVIGLGAVAWTDAWRSATPDNLLRLSIDPARLLELLKGLPVSKALVADLQKAVPSGRAVEVLVTADHEVAEIHAGSGLHLLTAAARDAVLKALGAALPASAAHLARSGPAAVPPDVDTFERESRPQGVLWQAPGAAHTGAGQASAGLSAAATATELFSLALPWLGAAAQLQVERDGAGPGTTDEETRGAPRVFCATLKLELPRFGPFEARIRVCGNAVAVEVQGCGRDGGAAAVGAHLDELAQGLRRQGLECAHVGLARPAPAAAS
jgi:hypothetical protein